MNNNAVFKKITNKSDDTQSHVTYQLSNVWPKHKLENHTDR